MSNQKESIRRNILEEIINKEVYMENEQIVGELVFNMFTDDIEEVEHFQLIFKYKEKYYRVPYIYLDTPIFNVSLDEYDGEDIYQYIDELNESSSNIERNELIGCTLILRDEIKLSKDQVLELFENGCLYEDNILIARVYDDEYILEDNIYIKPFIFEDNLYGLRYSGDARYLNKEFAVINSCLTLPHLIETLTSER